MPRIVEHRIDGNLTVKRYIVPDDTTEDDTPIGSSLLDGDESKGLLSKQSKPDNIMPGDAVRLRKSDGSVTGSVVGKLKSGKFQVKWEQAVNITEENPKGELSGRYENTELSKIY